MSGRPTIKDVARIRRHFEECIEPHIGRRSPENGDELRRYVRTLLDYIGVPSDIAIEEGAKVLWDRHRRRCHAKGLACVRWDELEPGDEQCIANTYRADAAAVIDLFRSPNSSAKRSSRRKGSPKATD